LEAPTNPAELDQCGSAAAEARRQGVGEIVLAVQVPLVRRQLLGDAKCLPGRQDSDLRHRVRVAGQRGDERA
jgi:hypothetical protein